MTKKIIFLSMFAIIAFLIVYKVVSKDKKYAIGVTELSFTDNSRMYQHKPRNIEVVVWYPIKSTEKQQKTVHGIWEITGAQKDALIFPSKLPLVLFSHGFGGEPYGNSWFAQHLAAHGYIVASVRHSGNAYDNIIPEISARPWNRPQDMRFVLDQLLTNSSFKNSIDEHKIGVAGFSQGGITSLWLAGMQGDLTQESLRKLIETIKDPAWKAIHEQFTQEDIKAANASYKDKRIKAAFAMAPGLDSENWLFTNKEKVAQVNIPIYIVVGGSDITVSKEKNAEFFAAHIPNSTLTILPGEVIHWTFMNESTPEGKKINPTITIDDPTINRHKIHKEVNSMALKFFEKYLK